MSSTGSADEALGRAEELLERLKATREELTELAELAKEVEAELGKARARADAPQP